MHWLHALGHWMLLAIFILGLFTLGLVALIWALVRWLLPDKS